MKRDKTPVAESDGSAAGEGAAPPSISPMSGGGAAPVANLAAEKDRLILAMDGPHGLMSVAVQNDPVLHERLALAITDGMPHTDLTTTPMHRRADAVEAALDSWQELTRNGPCDYCGTRVARRGMDAPGYLDPEVKLQFTKRSDGHAACSWCADFLSGHNVEELREVVFNAIAGTVGMAGYEPRAHKTLTPMAHEVGTYGTPWGHVTGNPVLVRACQMRAEQVVHPSRFVRTPGAARRISVPGIETPIHTAETIPHPPVKHASLGAAARLAKENDRHYAALRERRERDQKKWDEHCAALRKRDERMESMEPDEAQRFLERLAR